VTRPDPQLVEAMCDLFTAEAVARAIEDATLGDQLRECGAASEEHRAAILDLARAGATPEAMRLWAKLWTQQREADARAAAQQQYERGLRSLADFEREAVEARRALIAWNTERDDPAFVPDVTGDRRTFSSCMATAIDGEAIFLCSRRQGHDRRHAAGDGTRVIAVWSGDGPWAGASS